MYLLLLLVCSYFAKSFYLSYKYNKVILFFSYRLSPLEFLVLFYIFLALWFYKKGFICFKKPIYMISTLFLLTSFVLLLLEQYSFLILFSFSFLLSLTKNKYFLFLFFVFINGALTVLFESG